MNQALFCSKMFVSLVLVLLQLHNGRFFFTCLAKEAPHDITTDTSALLAFRDQLITTSDANHALINNWISGTSNKSTPSVCDWIGVTCGTRHQRVVALELGDLGLSGTIPPHMGNLSFLSRLDIRNNSFHGNFPKDMAHLRRLSVIDVCWNNFSGDIPSWFGSLPQLKYLCLDNNSFTGRIPPSISNCSKLEFLSTSYNPLNGVIPQEIGKLQKLKILAMQGNQLTGSIPPSIFNISSLEILALTSNGISGNLPADMCSSLPNLNSAFLSINELEGRIPSNIQFCSRLETLSLSYNEFHGAIPTAIGNLTMLKQLFLGGNNLEGQIPSELSNLVELKSLGLESAGLGGAIPPSIFNNITSLESLVLSRNNLGGSIPNEIGNCTSIYVVDIEFNHLTGALPEPIGRLPNLMDLRLTMNNLRGHVSTTFFNITSLGILSLSANHFMGHLPPTIGFGLPNIEQLYLGGNQFSGTIPDSISNASRLTILDLNRNNFTGSPPSTLGNLMLLDMLLIRENNLKLNGEMFIASLNSCKYLRLLDISYSQVNGPLPTSFGNLTSSLQDFEARNCRIIGKIPQDIVNMSNLRIFDLALNQLVGSLPNTLRALPNLEQLDASENNLSGLLPDDICHLPRLGKLVLSGNRFFGSLPDCLGNVTTFRYLYLTDNNLSGTIPASLWTLKDILQLDLSFNSFNGYLPPGIGTLRAATAIILSRNQLLGTLPSEIGSLQTLAQLSLGHNKFEGSIPESYGKLLSMVELDLSHNNLSGEIPRSLEALPLLKILNLSFNQLSGEIPSGGPFKNLTYLSFESNKALCGSPRFHVPQCQSDGSSKPLKKIRKVIILCALMGMTLLTLVLATLYVMLNRRKKHQSPYAEDLPPAIIHERISYHELLRATNSFDESNLLGMGSYGSVYKGVFDDSRIWAVKVFNLQVERAIRSFEIECEILRSIRHRNLTKVISSCTNLDFMALVLEYMPNGSLDKWLYSHNYLLGIKQRLDIMIDVASALDYLHHGHSVPVVHCDLKPSNVLLDADMVARVSDFGISKLLKEGNTAQTNTLATIGYTAPEYGREGLVSTTCDVYSFGIMLMEVFTRRRPTDERFSEEFDLKRWVIQSLPDRVMKVTDENLVKQQEHEIDAVLQCVSAILELASNCTYDSPEQRMNMKDVCASLQKIKLRFHVMSHDLTD